MNLESFVSTEGLVDKACSLRRHGLPTRIWLGSMKNLVCQVNPPC